MTPDQTLHILKITCLCIALWYSCKLIWLKLFANKTIICGSGFHEFQNIKLHHPDKDEFKIEFMCKHCGKLG